MGVVEKGSAFCAALLVIASAATGQKREIDVGRSTMTVHVSKAGVFSAFGHDHEIGAPITQGAVDAAAKSVDLRVKTAGMRVLDPKVSEADRAEIQSTMLGPKVLDAGRYPEIIFRSTKAEASGSGAWRVIGDLTLHGRTKPVSVEVHQNGERYVGTARFKQTEFGIQPVAAAGGSIRVKDEVQIEFDIQLSR
jgi:polyisoprenoid-binding protein YceI